MVDFRKQGKRALGKVMALVAVALATTTGCEAISDTPVVVDKLPTNTPRQDPNKLYYYLEENDVHLYGIFAGLGVAVYITPEYPTLWEALYSKVTASGESVDLGQSETKRLTANLLRVIAEQYAHRDLDKVNEGDRFAVDVPTFLPTPPDGAATDCLLDPHLTKIGTECIPPLR